MHIDLVKENLISNRKKVLIPILIAMSTTGIITALMPNYVTFIIARQVNDFFSVFIIAISATTPDEI